MQSRRPIRCIALAARCAMPDPATVAARRSADRGVERRWPSSELHARETTPARCCGGTHRLVGHRHGVCADGVVRSLRSVIQWALTRAARHRMHGRSLSRHCWARHHIKSAVSLSQETVPIDESCIANARKWQHGSLNRRRIPDRRIPGPPARAVVAGGSVLDRPLIPYDGGLRQACDPLGRYSTPPTVALAFHAALYCLRFPPIKSLNWLCVDIDGGREHTA